MSRTVDRACDIEQIARDAAISRVLERVKPSAVDCERCGDPLGEARKRVCPEAVLCIRCQRIAEAKAQRR